MNPKNPPLKFRKAWSWPKGLENFLQTFLISPSLHVCCGESQLGDYKVDAYLIRREVIQADMFNLPFRDGFFASAMSERKTYPNCGYPHHEKTLRCNICGYCENCGG